MNSTATALSLPAEKPYLGPALVSGDEQKDGTVRVRLDGPGPRQMISARVAVERARPLVAGDRVLIAGDPARELYVIGVIEPSQPQAAPPAVLQADNGACAVMAGSDRETSLLRVYSPRHELVFEYDPVRERARVNVTRGCLELSTEDGDIELRAARTVRIGGHAIEMNSHGLMVKAISARWIVDRLETLAGTIVEKARNAYRTVEQLAQLRTGSMRTLVDQTYQFKSRKAFLKSEEDFKIKSEKIHLG